MCGQQTLRLRALQISIPIGVLMTNLLKIIEAGCILGLLIAVLACSYLWLVN